MAITIQDLLASDTISQAVDKINFNFDQLLLNGGGPVGPPGAQGPSGPIGGRGERGTEWYQGVNTPIVVPPTATPLDADFYLQSNGDVWEYTGLAWTPTGINLTGPQGTPGTAVGWSQFGNDGSGNYQLTSKNVSYPSLLGPTDTTINAQNQGISVASFGIAGPNDSNIYLNSKFQITSAFAGQLDASLLSVLIRQGDSGANAIKFMGGDEISENYEQSDLSKLASINLGTDDAFNIIVPKVGTVGDSNQYTGFTLDTSNRGQRFRAGNGLVFETGTKGTADYALDNSNVEFTLNQLVGGAGVPNFKIKTIGTLSQTQTQIGPTAGIITLDPSFTGGAKFQVSDFGVAANSNITLLTGATAQLKASTNQVGVNPTNAFIQTTTGNINLDSSAGGDINIDTTGGDIEINSTGGNAIVQSNLLSVLGLTGPVYNSSLVMTSQLTSLIANGAGNTGNINLMIKSVGINKKMQIGLDTNNTGGVIEIGRPFGTAASYKENASITLSHNATTSPGTQDDKINITGRVAFMLQGTASAAPSSNATIFIDTGTTYYNTGDVVVMNGDPAAFLSGGVVQEQWTDFTNTGIFIGKGLGTNAGDPPSATQQYGIFVNGTSTFAQGSNYNPASERFKVTREVTQVNNNMIWRSGEEVKIDLFYNNNPIALPNPYILDNIDTSHFRIMVGPFANAQYTWINSQNGGLASPGFGSNPTVRNFTIDAPDNWKYGQRCHFELLTMTGNITVESPGGGAQQPYGGSQGIGVRWVSSEKSVNNTSTTKKYSDYIQTGRPPFNPIGTFAYPYYIRCSFTLQWNGTTTSFYGAPSGITALNNWRYKSGWSLVGVPVWDSGQMGGGGSSVAADSFFYTGNTGFVIDGPPN